MTSTIRHTSKDVRYIVITGGVASSLGKGILASSLGLLLQSRGFRVTIQKFDPYLNVDPGTMNPYEHGECFVTEDGAETDLDLGHYERFLGQKTSRANNITAGDIYYKLLHRERSGDFLGQTVQVIPHLTDAIKQRMYDLGQSGAYDLVLVEVGGCVGDIESLPFVEAMRQVRLEVKASHVVFLHLTLVPYLESAGELKTKPTQQSVKALLSLGIQPDILLCRSSHALPRSIREKIALHCNIPMTHVVAAQDVHLIYDVPLRMRKEKLDERVLSKLKLPYKTPPKLDEWKAFVSRLRAPVDEVTIGLVGKYTRLQDAYLSIQEALCHAGAHQECKVKILWISAHELVEEQVAQRLGTCHGILVAPGFGERGVKGKLAAVGHARQNNIPFLGICLGMQCAVVEFARHVLKRTAAASTEINPNTKHPVIALMAEQKKATSKGGSMRLGAYHCQIRKNTKAHHLYGTQKVAERHRHRYEFNNTYLREFEEAGMCIAGTNPDSGLVELIELSNHPFFIGCQFHPEYRSWALRPHPLFTHFIKASLHYATHAPLKKTTVV